ncbi:hypothetical protein M2262_004335 [Pseudomonas sp. BIGb0408]|uniref:Uncharacterized protein n=1 Tax=Phytopseudomonas flavescens TaxID=29435 RepID=A0A7Y9XU54_9GAMM|nr:hypothetical protein [Pseudomonas sp. BIGb0408]NYH76441.1 hypothetical protein [Pseudomonas flavescens]
MATEERHPLSDAMRERVLEGLQRVERERNVKVLYACESGSRVLDDYLREMVRYYA